MPPFQARVAWYLLEHCRGPGPGGGVPPHRLRQAMRADDLTVATAVYALARLGVAGYDGETTTPFSDPTTLQGYRMTNVYLTDHGWQTLTPGELRGQADG